jgi:endonuclease-3
MDVAKTMKSIYQLLKPLYPNPGSALLGPHANNPLDVLILTILSQATNDTLSARAFKSLKASFGSWEEVMEADQGKLEKVLSVGGLQRAKSKVIREALVKITRDFRAPTLEPLKDFDRKRAFDYLLSLPGVGPKTAACVLVFGLGKPAFPVDTHILRIVRRLGLTGPRSSSEKVQKELEISTPDQFKLSLHTMLIAHGRNICTARKPKCQVCPLSEMCFYKR